MEQLETRALLAALPYGATADDTGEFMLGNVAVSVVLLESNSGIFPNDPSTENWTSSAIAAVKQKVEAGVNWWKETLDALPDVRDGLLNFTYDWTYADAPVQTGYEAITRPSNDFAGWIYDFLGPAGFNQKGNFSTDIRAFNNFQRQQHKADWAFTIFVVNNSHELATGGDGRFDPTGDFDRAFAFAGGRFMVVPADRPASTFAHEAGHMFWALDEYAGGGNFAQRRGYYNTQNANATTGNPDGGFSQAISIMTNEPGVSAAYGAKTSSQSSLEMLGWKDSDGDGIFDVLDVPFSLTGSGDYNEATGQYRFTGQSTVRTLPNKNTSGLQNDITINRIRQVEVSIDGNPWQTIATYDTYSTAIDISFPVPAGEHTITIRTHDTRTGVYSDLFVGHTNGPTQSTTEGGINGYSYKDLNGDGSWGSNEPAFVDLGIEVIDENGEPVTLIKHLNPNQYAEGAVLNQALSQATLSALGGDAANNQVIAKTSVAFPSAQKVFHGNSIIEGRPVEKWTGSSRVLRVDFTQAVSSVSIKALSSGQLSFARLEAYDAAGKLLQRTTSSALISGRSEVLSIDRATTDIAYVLAKGHAGTDVLLDDLKWGPRLSATTNAQGAYSLAFLPAGTYRVRAVTPPNHVAVTPTDGVAVVTVAGSGIAESNVNFAFREESAGNPWYNSAYAVDVNGNNSLEPLDALLVINYLNANPSNFTLPATREPGQWQIDVDNNGICTPLDALLVINRLNAQGPPTSPATAPAFAGAGGAAEGETISASTAAPADAADYYARQPLHLPNIAGDDLVHVHDHDDHDDHHHDDQPLPNREPRALQMFRLLARSRHAPAARIDALRIDELVTSLQQPEAPALQTTAESLDVAVQTIASDVARSWASSPRLRHFHRS